MSSVSADSFPVFGIMCWMFSSVMQSNYSVLEKQREQRGQRFSANLSSNRADLGPVDLRWCLLRFLREGELFRRKFLPPCPKEIATAMLTTEVLRIAFTTRVRDFLRKFLTQFSSICGVRHSYVHLFSRKKIGSLILVKEWCVNYLKQLS